MVTLEDVAILVGLPVNGEPITYNPDENLYELTDTIATQVNKIIIVDNNSQGKALEIILRISDFKSPTLKIHRK